MSSAPSAPTSGVNQDPRLNSTIQREISTESKKADRELLIEQPRSFGDDVKGSIIFTVGLFEALNFKIGVLFYKKNGKRTLLMPLADFDEFRARVEDITSALEGKLDGARFDVSHYKLAVVELFGQHYVKVSRGKQSFFFSNKDWNRLIEFLPKIVSYQPQPSGFYTEAE